MALPHIKFVLYAFTVTVVTSLPLLCIIGEEILISVDNIIIVSENMGVGTEAETYRIVSTA